MVCLLPRAFSSLGFALQALLGAGTEIFQDIRGSASSHSCWLLAFKVPLSPYFPLLAFFLLKSTDYRDRRQQQAAELKAEKVHHLSCVTAHGCCFSLLCICNINMHSWPGFVSGNADLNPDTLHPIKPKELLLIRSAWLT